MELPELGKHCALDECNKLDFLSFKCSHCHLIFCKEHHMPDNHKCTQCDKSVILSTVPLANYKCSYENCNSVSPVEMNCRVCKHHFCLDHRHHGCIDEAQAKRDKKREKWEAPKKQFELARQEANRQVNECLARAKKKQMANQIQLMRLKGKAVGSLKVPMADRKFFLVFPPLNLARKSSAVFVAKQWPLGKVIDSIARLCNVPNKNNEANSCKLRLFHQSDGIILSTQMEKVLEDMIEENELIDGESFILEYVDESDLLTRKIDNLEEYKPY